MNQKERIASNNILERVKEKLLHIDSSELLNRAEHLAHLLEIQMSLAQDGRNILQDILEDVENFHSYDHVPSPDVYDTEAGYQYYYHSHYHNEREDHEHGHFHLFYDLRKHPRADDLIPEDIDRKKRVLTHLMAFSVNARGELIRIFTVNGWVADDVSIDSPLTYELLKDFEIKTDTRYPTMNEWTKHLVQTTLPLSDLLLRDRADIIQKKAEAKGSQNAVLQDKEFEVPSSAFVSLGEWALALDEAAEQRDIELLAEHD